ncbi:hypothetical protein TorRG33x02_107540, partial [Trema orientale]
TLILEEVKVLGFSEKKGDNEIVIKLGMSDKYTRMFQLQYRYLHHGFSTINTETSLILVAAITVIVIVVTMMITGIPNPTPSPMLELCDLQLRLHKELHPLQLQLLSKLHPLLLHLHHLLQL